MLNAVQNPERIAPLGLASSAFARHYSQNLGWLLFLALLRCFSSGGSLLQPMDSVTDLVYCDTRGFPIRKSAGRWIFAPNRSLSQLVTSFVGSQCQGILLVLFLAWPLCLNLLELFEIVCSWISSVPIIIFHIQYLSILACSRSVFLLFSFQSTIVASQRLAKT